MTVPADPVALAPPTRTAPRRLLDVREQLQREGARPCHERAVLRAWTHAHALDSGARRRLEHVLVGELHEAAEQPLQLPEPRDDRLRTIARLLHENPADNTPLAELGRAAGAGSRTLSRLLRDELGMTFYEWRTQLRIYHALVLLAAGHDTAYVAHACGWANPSGFIAAFAAIVGTTPGRHRAEQS